MKKGRILLFTWLLVSLSPFVYAEPPIEVIYWQALDVETPSQEELDSFHDVMVEIQSFFSSEMDRHGFGKKTFEFKDIVVAKGKQKLSEYRRDMTSHREIRKESDLIEWGLDNQIYVVFLGGARHLVTGAMGLSQQLCAVPPEQLIYCNNMIVVSADIPDLILPVTAHEIGHAFSLSHSHQQFMGNRVDVMFAPVSVTLTLKNYMLSEKDATFLNENGRLAVQDSEDMGDQEIVLDTDVNGDGYTDLSDVLIVRSAMSVDNLYDTDINNDGVTNILDLMLVKAAAFEAIAAAAPLRRKVITTTWGELKRR